MRPLLPPQKARPGRPPRDHRQIVNGLLWLNRLGVTSRDAPEQYGPWQTIATPFYKRCPAGIRDLVLEELQQKADAEGKLDRSPHHVDGTIIRSHQHIARA